MEDQTHLSIRRNYNLSPLLNYLRMHYDEDISLKEAADMVNLTPNHLSEFHNYQNQTIRYCM